jgi:hypothetical protein
MERGPSLCASEEPQWRSGRAIALFDKLWVEEQDLRQGEAVR